MHQLCLVEIQGQPAQPLHLHHPHLDHGYQRNPAEGFSSFQQQVRVLSLLLAQVRATSKWYMDVYQAVFAHSSVVRQQAFPCKKILHRTAVLTECAATSLSFAAFFSQMRRTGTNTSYRNRQYITSSRPKPLELLLIMPRFWLILKLVSHAIFATY